jgi:hypothetical protein
VQRCTTVASSALPHSPIIVTAISFKNKRSWYTRTSATPTWSYTWGTARRQSLPQTKSCWQDGASRACSSSALWGVARSQPHWHRWAAPRHQPRRGHHLDNVPGSNAQDLGMALLHLERVYRSTSYCTLARPKPKKQRGLGMEQPGAPASFR